MTTRPADSARTVRLVAGLMLRRFVNRFGSGFRRRRKAAQEPAVRRTGTGRKGSFGWAGGVFLALIMVINGVNLASRLLINVRATFAPVMDGGGHYEISPDTHAKLFALARVREREGDTQAEAVKALFQKELARKGLSAARLDEESALLTDHFKRNGAEGFVTSDEVFLPRLHEWESPSNARRLAKLLSAMLLVLAIAWLALDLGSGNQDLGRVEWTLEWLFTFPAPATGLFAAQIFGYAVSEPLMWCGAWPFLATVFHSAGWGWWSIGAGAGAALYFSLLIASLRVTVETGLRSMCAPPRLKNFQALFTVIGTLALFALLSNVGTSPLSAQFFSWALRLPDILIWSPFSLPTLMPAANPGVGVCLTAMAAAVLLFPLTAMSVCSWLVRDGLITVSSTYAGERRSARNGSRRRGQFFRGIVGKDVRLLLRDRNFLVQTLVVPIMLAGFQLVVNAGIIDAVRKNFQHAAVLAFGVGSYVLLATALTVLSVEGNSLWMLYTTPRSIESILFEKTKLWAVVAIVYAAVVLAICGWINPGLRPGDVVFAALALTGVAIYSFIAAGIGILATDPLETEVKRRVRQGMVQLYFFLTAMFAYALYAPSNWTRLGQVVLSALLAFALWQKVRDRAPFLLDPVAAPPPTISLADGLIAALAFFVLQGICTIILTVAHVPPGAGLFMAFVIAGAIVVMFTMLVFWRTHTRQVLLSVGLRSEPRDRPMGVVASCGLGLVAGVAAAGFAWAYLGAVEYFPALKELKTKTLAMPIDFGVWLPVLAIVGAPVFEEFIFRGLVFRGLRRSTTATLAIIGSAAIFAIVHPPISVIPVFVLGVVAAWSFERSKLLVSAITAHAVYNAAVVAMNWHAG